MGNQIDLIKKIENKKFGNEEHIRVEYYKKEDSGYNELPLKTEEYKIIGGKKYKWNYKKSKWFRV